MIHATTGRVIPRKKAYPFIPAVVVGVVCAAVGVYQTFWNVTVLDYGSPAATFFKPDAAPPGGRVLLWLTDVTWHRTWSSLLFVKIHCRMIDPFDPEKKRVIDGQINTEPHLIDLPTEGLGKLPPKSRPFVVPPECLPGDLTWDAYAQSTGGLFGSWNPRIARPPLLHLTVLPN